MNKRTNQYAELSAKEKARYDSYKDYVEPAGEQLPGTKLGAEARSKALKEGRVKTCKQARLESEA